LTHNTFAILDSTSNREESDSEEDRERILVSHTRWYRRERIACRIRLYSSVQLLGVCWYCVAPRDSPRLGFVASAGIAALLGQAAAHTCNRTLLALHVGLSATAAFLGAVLLRSLVSLLPDAEAFHASFRLEAAFVLLTGILLCLEVLSLQSSLAILCLPAHPWYHSTDRMLEARSMLLPAAGGGGGDGADLLYVDLAEPPPEQLASPCALVPAPTTAKLL